MPGLYVHVPFCARKCLYCDFYSEAGKLHLLDGYVAALLTEAGQYRGLGLNAHVIARPEAAAICLEAGHYGGPDFDTLYIGGGTPSVLGAARLVEMMRGLSACFDLSRLEEATVEANPDSASGEFLEAAANCGIGRISLGVQSLDSAELAKAGRLHDAGQALEAIARARSCGFADISADVIVGLPGQTHISLEKTLSGLLRSGVTHISAYCLSVEPGTGFAAHLPLDLPDDGAQAALFGFAARYLQENGFKHYEISNFALPGRECRHNLNYWRGGEYLGLGPAAASHLDGRRSRNAPDLQKYLENPLGAQCEVEALGAVSKAAEEAMLRLRLLEEGLDISSLAARYGPDNISSLLGRLDKLVEGKLLSRVGTGYFLPGDGVMTSNRVFIEIIN